MPIPLLDSHAAMDIGVEISLYPLQQHFTGPILSFIERLRAESRLRVVSNSMSTQVFGEYGLVMQTLERALRTGFEQGTAVFVLKVMGPLGAGAGVSDPAH
jgi:uncharacterized protein YqgV (UPF0045/DUF77 family)